MANYNWKMKELLGVPLAVLVFLFLAASTHLGQSKAPTDKPLFELQRSQTAYIDTPVEIYGTLELLNNYYGSFEKAAKTHYAFMLREKVIRLETTAFVYMRRGGKADEIYSKLSSMPQFAKLSGKFTVVIRKKDASSNAYGTNAELTDFTLGAEKPQPPKPEPKNPVGDVKLEYDRFRDETTLTGITHIIDCQDYPASIPFHFDIVATINLPGKEVRAPSNVTISLRAAVLDGTAALGTNPDFNFIVDGKLLRLGKGSSRMKTYDIDFYGERSETITTITISLDSFRSIANGNDVEAKIGELEFAPPKFDPKVIQRIVPVFREMLAKILSK